MVRTGKDVRPLVEMNLVVVPVEPAAAKSPLWVTVNDTEKTEDGRGAALSVNQATPPSVTVEPPEMVTVGVTCTSAPVGTSFQWISRQSRLPEYWTHTEIS